MSTGTVKWFNATKGYGFIQPEDGSARIFVQARAFGLRAHKPYVGERRYLMFNWIRSDDARRNHELRHHFSAHIKKLLPFFYGGH